MAVANGLEIVAERAPIDKDSGSSEKFRTYLRAGLAGPAGLDGGADDGVAADAGKVHVSVGGGNVVVPAVAGGVDGPETAVDSSRVVNLQNHLSVVVVGLIVHRQV